MKQTSILVVIICIFMFGWMTYASAADGTKNVGTTATSQGIDAAANGKVRRIAFNGSPDKGSAPRGPIILKSKQTSWADFQCEIPYLELVTVRLADGNDYVSLRIPDVTIPNIVGHPEQPYREELIRITPGSKVTLEIDDVEWSVIEGAVNLAPMQAPLPDARSPRGERPGAAMPFQKDALAYAANTFEDAAPVRLDGIVRIRGREYAKIIYAPASYNPAEKKLRLAHRVRFHLNISLPGTVKRMRPDRAVSPLPDTLDVRMPVNVAEEEAEPDFTPPPDIAASATDADYLIITPDAFADEVQPLADWKHRKGYRTYIATLTEVGGSTEAAIKAFIQNIYDNGAPPEFVLLIGDHENLPGGRVDYHPACYGSNVPFYSDLPYACVDGSDYYPDLTIGRLPGDTESQITIMVNKCLGYDRAPDASQRYDHALIAGMFEDDENGDYTANRWFMESLHRAGDFLGPDYDYFATETSKGYTVHTALRWVTDYLGSATVFDPMAHTLHYWSSSFPGRLAPPDPVPTSWKAFGNNDKTAINSAVNSGVGLLIHRDHGYASYDGQWYDGLGWGDPDYRTDDVNGLANGSKLPFVFSLNCGTGHWEDRDAFAEAWMRNSNGGAVGFTGAARVSYSGCNDAFLVGLMDTFWDDYSNSPNSYGAVNVYPQSFRPAQALDRARAYVMATYGSGDTAYGTLTARLFSWLGDPELALRTQTPVSLAATHPSEIIVGVPANFDVTVTQGGSSLAGALVALVLDPSDYHTATTNASGVAHFNFTPVSGGSMMITASEHDSVPYEGSITVSVVPLHTLTYTAGTNGSISGDTVQTVVDGGDGTAVEAVPDTGYHFVKWSDDVMTASRTDTNVTADISVTATFAINQYTLTYTAGVNGSISGTSPQTVNHGSDSTQVEAVPNTGYHFVQWSDSVMTAARTDTNVIGNITVTATFAINQYTLTYTAGAGGSISGTSPQTVNHGLNGTEVTAVPDTGYHFVKWSDDLTQNPRTDTNVIGNITVMANFEETPIVNDWKLY